MGLNCGSRGTVVFDGAGLELAKLSSDSAAASRDEAVVPNLQN